MQEALPVFTEITSSLTRPVILPGSSGAVENNLPDQCFLKFGVCLIVFFLLNHFYLLVEKSFDFGNTLVIPANIYCLFIPHYGLMYRCFHLIL